MSESVAKPKPISPLTTSGFVRINETLHFYTPPTSSSTTEAADKGSTDPEIILFLSWASAPLNAVLKYTAQYQHIYPHAKILLFSTAFADIFLHTPTREEEALDPAVKLLRSMVNDSPQKRPRILVHLFSNAGSYKFRELSRFYRQAAATSEHATTPTSTGETSSSILPVTMIVLDSAPGHPDFRGRMVGMQSQLPRQMVLYWLGSGIFFFLMCVRGLMIRVYKWTPVIDQVYFDLSNVSGEAQLLDQNAKRLYIYSKTDEIVDWREVLEHAADAQAKGCDVQTEEFVKSKHVAHAMVDGKRYWNLIRHAWAETSGHAWFPRARL